MSCDDFTSFSCLQGNEISIYKTRALGLEEEVKQLKAMNEQHIQKLRTEETGLLVSHLYVRHNCV